jgi:hypothetical protein
MIFIRSTQSKDILLFFKVLMTNRLFVLDFESMFDMLNQILTILIVSISIWDLLPSSLKILSPLSAKTQSNANNFSNLL